MSQALRGIDYTKGPYYAEAGDFSAVGSEHMRLTNDLPNQVSTSIGTLGDEDLFVGGDHPFRWRRQTGRGRRRLPSERALHLSRRLSQD